jgi:hypothetical protein
MTQKETRFIVERLRLLRNIRLVQFDRGGRRFFQLQIEHLDEDREGHREVDIAFGNVLIETLGDQVTPINRRKLRASIFTVG